MNRMTRLRPPTMLRPWLVTAPLLAAAVTALAQTPKPVFRCANGSYADTPCANGRALQVDDSRTAEQQAQAQDAARREARLAARLATDRRAEEAAAARQPAPIAGMGQKPAASAPHHPASAPARKHPRHKARDPAARTPGDEPARKGLPAGRLGQP